VVYFPDLDYRIKIKQEDYVIAHKIVTGLTKRRVWENMKEGKTLEEMCEIIPDEWHAWLKETYTAITADFALTWECIKNDYWLVMADLPLDYTRKDFALRVRGMQYEGFMFGILDGKSMIDKVWDTVKPSVE
jgi:RNA ligase